MGECRGRAGAGGVLLPEPTPKSLGGTVEEGNAGEGDRKLSASFLSHDTEQPELERGGKETPDKLLDFQIPRHRSTPTHSQIELPTYTRIENPPTHIHTLTHGVRIYTTKIQP